MGLVLELTFSCSSQQMFLYLENLPPLELSHDQHTWNYTSKFEVGSHDETSSVVHIYPHFIYCSVSDSTFCNLLMIHLLKTSTCLPTNIRKYFIIISLLIRILAVFSRLSYNCLWRGVISRILFVLFPICATCFYWTVKISSWAPIFLTLRIFLVIHNFWTMR